jgi:hypothetical protein
MTSVAEAFDVFRRHAAQSVGAVAEASYPEAFVGRVVTVTQPGAALRLVWDGKDERLSLEITHGPDENDLSWLDLFSASCPKGVLTALEPGFDFGSAVEYGFVLLTPTSKKGDD